MAGSFAILGAVIGRSSVAGIIVQALGLVLDAALPLRGTATPQLCTVLLLLLTVTFYLIAPVALAAIIFQKRDMLGVG